MIYLEPERTSLIIKLYLNSSPISSTWSNLKSFDATQYKNQFQKEKYDRIIVNVPKWQKEVITSYAKEHSYNSLNSFVVDAINEKMKK